MSLSGLMTALVEFVGDVLVNDCGRPVPDRVLRYHGVIPDDCCTDAGLLAVNWTGGFPSTRFPTSAASDNDLCVAPGVYGIAIRYRTCWPVPDADEAGVKLADAEWDETSAMLADVADCVGRELTDLTCFLKQGRTADPFIDAVADSIAPRGWLRYAGVAPTIPLGGCTGVTWTLSAAPRSGPGPS